MNEYIWIPLSSGMFCILFIQRNDIIFQMSDGMQGDLEENADLDSYPIEKTIWKRKL